MIEKIETELQQTTNNKPQIENEKSSPFSKRMIEINTELQNIKKQIKSNNLTLQEIEVIKDKLKSLFFELYTKKDSFYKIDNIPIKKKQISEYLNKLDELEKSMKIKD